MFDKKKLIIILMLFTCNHMLLSNRWITIGKVISSGIPLLSILPVVTQSIETRVLKRGPAIEPEINMFCQTVLANQINSNEIFIKKSPFLNDPAEAKGNDLILLDAQASDNIKKALERDDIKELEFYRYILLHERAHLEKNDPQKMRVGLFAANLGVVLASIFARNRYFKSNFFKNPSLIVAGSVLAGYAKCYAATTIFRPLQRHMEAQADRSAFSCFEKPSEMENIIDHLKSVEEFYDRTLFYGWEKEELQDFKKEQGFLYNLLFYMLIDARHPSPKDRIAQAEEYRETLLLPKK